MTGNGRTKVKRIELKVNKSRSGIIVPAIEVAGSLSITEAIIVTHAGYDFKAGDMFTLWKAGSFLSTSNVVIELPELADGLYWDTSELMKKEGKLKVTDTPTGIVQERVDRSQESGDSRQETIYDLQGRKQSILKKGLYIRNGKKIVIK